MPRLFGFALSSTLLLLCCYSTEPSETQDAPPAPELPEHWYNGDKADTIAAKCLTSYVAQNDEELSLTKGDNITVLHRKDSRWFGSVGDAAGYFPPDHVKILDPSFPDSWDTQDIPVWSSDDRVEVWYSKMVLSRWHIPGRDKLWNTHHAGITFTNNSTGKVAFFDFAPWHTEDAGKILFPNIHRSVWMPTWRLHELPFRWKRKSYVKYFDHNPPHFSRHVRVAVTNGTALNNYTQWLRQSGAPDLEFYPDAIFVQSPVGTDSVIAPYSCMEFADDSLRALHEAGVQLDFAKSIGKDYSIFYAAKATILANISECSRCGRQLLRTFRLWQLTLSTTKDLAFHHFRGIFMTLVKAGMPAFMPANGVTYRLEPTPPFLNHCRIPVPYPWETSNVFDPPLCALPQKLDALPVAHFHWLGAIIVAEEKLDRPSVFAALFLAAVAAALLPKASVSDAQQSEQSQ